MPTLTETAQRASALNKIMYALIELNPDPQEAIRVMQILSHQLTDVDEEFRKSINDCWIDRLTRDPI